MTTGETKSGFKFTIDERVKTDWDFLEVVDKIQAGDHSIATIKSAFTMILPGDQFEELKAHIRKSNDGFVPTDILMDELKEIVSTEALKKS